MPAAAVIPAPIAYINVVVVKKLVVGSRRAAGRSALLQPLLWFLFCPCLCFAGLPGR